MMAVEGFGIKGLLTIVHMSDSQLPFSSEIDSFFFCLELFLFVGCGFPFNELLSSLPQSPEPGTIFSVAQYI